MANVRIRITTNQDIVIRRFRQIDENTMRRIKQQIFLSSMNIENQAKRAAPVDTGALRASITTKIFDRGLRAITGSNKKYAPFREFGTGKQTNVPSGFGSVASQFKGSGKSPPPRALRGWAKRHGMEGLEFVLARHIGREGTKPQPFLIPAFKNEKPRFEQNIKNILRRP